MTTTFMSVPTQRHTKSRKRKRRATKKTSSPTLTICPKCKRPVLPHRACSFCGTYQGKEVLKIRLKKSERKARAKEEKERKKDEKKSKNIKKDEKEEIKK